MFRPFSFEALRVNLVVVGTSVVLFSVAFGVAVGCFRFCFGLIDGVLNGDVWANGGVIDTDGVNL